MDTDKTEVMFECPFCGEKDFDKVGLKIHLTMGQCEIYNEIDVFRHAGAGRRNNDSIGD